MQRSVDAYGKEIFVEKQDERGRPVIWYKLNRRGNRMRYLRKGSTVRETVVARIAESQA